MKAEIHKEEINGKIIFHVKANNQVLFIFKDIWSAKEYVMRYNTGL